jgi:hypothetical protein
MHKKSRRNSFLEKSSDPPAAEGDYALRSLNQHRLDKIIAASYTKVNLSFLEKSSDVGGDFALRSLNQHRL